MTAKYLLPCLCGQRIVVEPRQAGEMLVCSCGASVQAPTLLQITALDPSPAETQVEPIKAAWGFHSRMRLLGSLLLGVALAGGIWLYWERPVSRFDTIDPEQLRETAKSLPPSHSWEIWKTMKQGLDRRIDQQYAAAMSRFRAWQVTVAATGLLGAVLLVAGTVGRRTITG